MPDGAGILDQLATVAARAPSVHNTQPWRFRSGRGPVGVDVVELHADPSRRLDRVDPDGREMIISCGAALFGLRLAVRKLERRAVVNLLPQPGAPDLLARVRLGAAAPVRGGEHRLIAAVTRRHTHRGPFDARPLPDGLLGAMQRDAEAEGATLVLVHEPGRFARLAALVAAADRRHREHPVLARELRTWTRPRGSLARDGVPARAFAQRAGRRPGALAQRDFDLGRRWGTLVTASDAPAATGVLVTAGDRAADWLRAGQALHRVLLRAAGDWVFARMYTQPLEIAAVRAAVRHQLHLPGAPQMVLQFGRAGVAPVTPRRPVLEMVGP